MKGWDWWLLYRLDGVDGKEGWCGDRFGWGGGAYYGDGVEVGVGVAMGWEFGVMGWEWALV